jgi:hypothetical protein
VATDLRRIYGVDTGSFIYLVRRARQVNDFGRGVAGATRLRKVSRVTVGAFYGPSRE